MADEREIEKMESFWSFKIIIIGVMTALGLINFM